MVGTCIGDLIFILCLVENFCALYKIKASSLDKQRLRLGTRCIVVKRRATNTSSEVRTAHARSNLQSVSNPDTCIGGISTFVA